MHRTLKAETTRPSEQNLIQQQERFERFRREFDFERPHGAFGDSTPASCYQQSEREMPAALPGPKYPAHLEIRRVSRAGTFRFKKRLLFLSQALRGERVALGETGDGAWSLYFYDVVVPFSNSLSG